MNEGLKTTPSPTRRTFHMLTADEWRTALRRGRVEPESLAAEGFVHTTDTAEELARTANRHYAADPRQFLALTVDLPRVHAPWRYDDPSSPYPHVYGPVNLDAVIGVRRLTRDPAGRFLDPQEVSVNVLAPLLDRIEAAGARIASLRPPVERGEPWPSGAVADDKGEAEWSPTEVLAHAAEMLPYWLGEMERVIAAGANGAEPAPFGRTATDQIRTLSVIRDSTLPARELFDRIASALERYRWRLPELTDDEAGRRGTHPTRGEVTVAELLERFAVGHLEDHADQLEKRLG